MILHLQRFVLVSQMLLGPNPHILPHMLHVFLEKLAGQYETPILLPSSFHDDAKLRIELETNCIIHKKANTSNESFVVLACIITGCKSQLFVTPNSGRLCDIFSFCTCHMYFKMVQHQKKKIPMCAPNANKQDPKSECMSNLDLHSFE